MCACLSFDGVQCTRLIKEAHPEVRIIILTTFDDDEYVYNALKYGASGYLLKGVSVPELTQAVRTVVSGGAMINPNIALKVVKLFPSWHRVAFPCRWRKGAAALLSRTEHQGNAAGRAWPVQQGNR